MSYALSVGAITEEGRLNWLAKCWAALLQVDTQRASELAGDTPVSRFLALLADGFSSRQAYVEDERGEHPGDAQRWGWKMYTWFDRDGNDNHEWRHEPGATLLGTITDDWMLLIPEATMQFVQSRERAAGRVFPVEMRTLLLRLDEDGLIATQRKGKSISRTPVVRVGEATPRRIKLAITALTASNNQADVSGGNMGNKGNLGNENGSVGTKSTQSPVSPNGATGETTNGQGKHSRAEAIS